MWKLAIICVTAVSLTACVTQKPSATAKTEVKNSTTGSVDTKAIVHGDIASEAEASVDGTLAVSEKLLELLELRPTGDTAATQTDLEKIAKHVDVFGSTDKKGNPILAGHVNECLSGSKRCAIVPKSEN